MNEELDNERSDVVQEQADDRFVDAETHLEQAGTALQRAPQAQARRTSATASPCGVVTAG